MPRRSRRAHRDRLEASLSPAARAFLAEISAACGVGRDWQAVEDLQVCITQVTVMQRAIALRRMGATEDAALEQAAAFFEVPVETIRTRHQRWYRETRSHNEPAATQEPAVVSIGPSQEHVA